MITYDRDDYQKAGQFLRKLNTVLEDYFMIESSDAMDAAIDACDRLSKPPEKPPKNDVSNYIQQLIGRKSR